MRNLLMFILSLSLMGCSGLKGISTQTALDKVNSGKSVNPGNIPQCLMAYEEFELDANLLAFEIYSKKGFEFGFNLVTGLLKMLGLSFRTEKGLMTMTMGISESIDPTNWVAYAQGQAKSKRKEFQFDIGLSQMGLGMSYFKQTPMSDLTGNTIKNNLMNLRDKMETKAVRWKTRVVHANEEDGFLVIPVGGMSKIMPGDQFNIYNVNYIWKDQPCESELLIPQKTTTEPLAVAQAVQVENNATILRIMETNYEESIDLGAMVEVNQLMDDRQLSQPVKIRSVDSQPLLIGGYEELDLTVYLDEQIRAFMDLYGFHPRN